MLQQKKYTKIYTAYDDYGYLQLLLYNDIKADALIFDGIKFTYYASLPTVPTNYKPLKYPGKLIDATYEVESVRQSGDSGYIKFKDGDVFQLYFMMDDEKSNQRLSIFQEEEHRSISTPLGISLYDSVLQAVNDAEECEIATEK